MSKNLSDLNNILFNQLERLSNPDLEGEKLNEEIQRTEAVVKVSGQIIGNANLVLQALKHKDNTMDAGLKLPELLQG